MNKRIVINLLPDGSFEMVVDQGVPRMQVYAVLSLLAHQTATSIMSPGHTVEAARPQIIPVTLPTDMPRRG